jgi:hypothetical protein
MLYIFFLILNFLKRVKIAYQTKFKKYNVSDIVKIKIDMKYFMLG